MFFLFINLMAQNSLPDIEINSVTYSQDKEYEEIQSDNSFRLVENPGRTTSSTPVEMQKWEYQESDQEGESEEDDE